MKYKYYLARTIRDGFLYARGDSFASEDIEGLALVKLDLYKDLNFKGNWTLIDVKSGLSVYNSLSRKKIIEFWTKNCDRLIIAIKSARAGETYRNKRLPELEKEKQLWRESGYNVED